MGLELTMLRPNTTCSPEGAGQAPLPAFYFKKIYCIPNFYSRQKDIYFFVFCLFYFLKEVLCHADYLVNSTGGSGVRRTPDNLAAFDWC